MIEQIFSSDKKIHYNFGADFPKIIWADSRRSFLKLFKRSFAIRLFQVFAIALFFSFVSPSPLWAIETIKASALKLDLEQHVRSFTTVPPSAPADSCLPLLKQVRLSPQESDYSQSRRTSLHHANAGQKASMPVTLGFLIGVRVALGPKEVVKPGHRVLIGPELVQHYDTGESYALAVARYRNCKRHAALNKN